MTILGSALYFYWKGSAKSYDNSIYLKLKGVRQTIDEFCRLKPNPIKVSIFKKGVISFNLSTATC